MLIISLSTIPPRFDRIGPTLDSLLRQSVRPDRIVVYVPRAFRRFPDYDGRLPQVPEGVEIRVVDKDYGPASKVLHAVREYRGQDCDILFCDDDLLYPPDMAEALLAERRRIPDACIATSGFEGTRIAPCTMQRSLQPRAERRARATDLVYQAKQAWHGLARRLAAEWRPGPTRAAIRRAGYVDIFEGCGGVLVRPEFFDDHAFEIPDVMWTVDDVWLSGMIAKAGRGVWLCAGRQDPVAQRTMGVASLAHSVIEGADRAGANAACFAYLRETYGIWP